MPKRPIRENLVILKLELWWKPFWKRAQSHWRKDQPIRNFPGWKEKKGKGQLKNGKKKFNKKKNNQK